MRSVSARLGNILTRSLGLSRSPNLIRGCKSSAISRSKQLSWCPIRSPRRPKVDRVRAPGHGMPAADPLEPPARASPDDRPDFGDGRHEHLNTALVSRPSPNRVTMGHRLHSTGRQFHPLTPQSRRKRSGADRPCAEGVSREREDFVGTCVDDEAS